MTADEFYEFTRRPENERRWFELVRGDAIELPPPRKRHGIVCAKIAGLLGNHAAAHGGNPESNDAGVVLEQDPDTVRGPDIAFFDNEPSEDELDGYSTTLPVLVVEVLSPDDRADRVTRKITDYLQSGIPLVWLVDPAARNVTVYKPMAMPQLLEATEILTGGEALPEFECKVEDLFPKFQPAKKGTRGRRGKASERT